MLAVHSKAIVKSAELECWQWRFRATIGANTNVTMEGSAMTKAEAQRALRHWIETMKAVGHE